MSPDQDLMVEVAEFVVDYRWILIIFDYREIVNDVNVKNLLDDHPVRRVMDGNDEIEIPL